MRVYKEVIVPTLVGNILLGQKKASLSRRQIWRIISFLVQVQKCADDPTHMSNRARRSEKLTVSSSSSMRDMRTCGRLQ